MLRMFRRKATIMIGLIYFFYRLQIGIPVIVTRAKSAKTYPTVLLVNQLSQFRICTRAVCPLKRGTQDLYRGVLATVARLSNHIVEIHVLLHT